MHIYLDAAKQLEDLVAKGLEPPQAMAVICKRFSLEPAERELQWWAFHERRKGGIVKPIRTIKKHP